MGNGVSAQIPDTVDKEQAKTLLGEKFDEAKFDAAAKDGVVDKDTFLAAVAAAAEAEKTTATATEAEKTADETAEKPAGGGEAAAAAPAPAPAAAATEYVADPTDVPTADVEALHSRVRWNKEQEEIQKALTANPAMVHARDPKNGNYPLHIAAQNSHTDLVKLLLAAKSDPNKQNLAGQTALHMTTTYEMQELCDMLAAAGANPDIKNGEGHMAKHGLEGKKNSRYQDLQKLLEAPTEEALLGWFDSVLTNPENLEKTEIMKIVNFQAKKKMKADGSWTEAVNTKFTELVRNMP